MTENPAPDVTDRRSEQQAHFGNTAWQEWKGLWRDPITLFTLCLAIVGFLQWCTLKNMRDDAIATERAFVFTNNAELAPNKDKNPTNWLFSPIWENGGATTTEGLILQGNYTMIDWEPAMTRCDFKVVQPLVSIGSKGRTKLAFFSIPSDAIKAFQSGTAKSFHIWGWAKYGDGFGTQRITRFCWVPEAILGDPVDGPSLRIIHSLCPEGNCIDDECKKEDEKLFPNGAPKSCEIKVLH
ncbi:MAG: hypothetical protein P4L87_03185 [Formivibrio sp.]|nr:hypothetical protein [Formivibrio sp.]